MSPRYHLLPTSTLAALLVTLSIFAAAVFSVSAAEIEVASTSGQKITVEVLGYTASSGNVRIKRSDGQIINTKISVFDKASQEKIVANAPKESAKLDLEVSVGKKRERDGDSSYRKTMIVTTSVKVSNQSRDIDLPQTKFTLLLVGRNSKRYADRDQDWYKVLSVQTFSTELVAGKASEHELKTIKTSYDSDKDDSNLGGWEFEGYLLVGQNADGKVVTSKTNLGAVSTTTVKQEKLILAAIALKEGTETQHDLSPLVRR